MFGDLDPREELWALIKFQASEFLDRPPFPNYRMSARAQTLELRANRMAELCRQVATLEVEAEERSNRQVAKNTQSPGASPIN